MNPESLGAEYYPGTVDKLLEWAVPHLVEWHKQHFVRYLSPRPGGQGLEYRVNHSSELENLLCDLSVFDCLINLMEQKQFYPNQVVKMTGRELIEVHEQTQQRIDKLWPQHDEHK